MGDNANNCPVNHIILYNGFLYTNLYLIFNDLNKYFSSMYIMIVDIYIIIPSIATTKIKYSRYESS